MDERRDLVDRKWLLVIPMRPTLTNAVHNMHYRKASADRKLWRKAGKDAAERADLVVRSLRRKAGR